MKQERGDSGYADPAREDKPEILSTHSKIISEPLIDVVLQENPAVVGILNKHRQFVIINKSYFNAQDSDQEMLILGMRPGEVFGCIHADTYPEGCGTSDKCRYCDAVNTILDAMKEKSTITRETRITTEQNGTQTAHDLQVTAKPFEHEGNLYILLSVIDISGIKRKKALESIFFHDIINSTASLHSLFSMLNGEVVSLGDEMKTLIREGELIVDSINEQLGSFRDLTRAENNELGLSVKRHDIKALLRQTASAAEQLSVCKTRDLSIDLSCPDIEADTDEHLFRRVVLNMIKNALEASRDGAHIEVLAEADDRDVSVSVHNQGVMTPEVQAQVFQRSYSTKGHNRGLGTYSMKLLGERYLKGRVSFVSSGETGTVFTFRFPREI